MEPDIARSGKNFKVTCSDYPPDFDRDKSICKQYFRQFGRVRRLIFKQRQRVITVEYTNEISYLNALDNAGEYNSFSFVVTRDETPKRDRKTSPKKHNIFYIDNDEINQELAAMRGCSNPSVMGVTSPKSKPKPKLNRVWQKDLKLTPVSLIRKKASAVKKQVKEKVKSDAERELLKLVNSQAQTVEEKYMVLDARDKLLRLNQKKLAQLKSGPTAGTCPDMCPEKERLLREIQHQIALFEQDEAEKKLMNPNKAVKQYSRSSADQETPLPYELRPVNVLQLTMNYLMYNIMDLCDNSSDLNMGEWFHFLWDRTRGIRKDITQQALCCQGSVELVEQCARFHIHCSARLMGEDPSVFDQKINTENLTKCLQTLKYMYHDLRLKGETCPNEAEFRAYVILLNLHDGNFLWEVQELRPEVQKSPEIHFALQVYSAFEKNNYVKFFKLVRSTTYLNACILMRYFVQVRAAAIKVLIKCFTPPKSVSSYPVEELTELLFFDDAESTVDFMRSHGVQVNKESTHFMLQRNTFQIPENLYHYVLERSPLIENKRTTNVGIVVCGKEMSPEAYLTITTHQVQNSFDNNGYLVQDQLFSQTISHPEENEDVEEEEEEVILTPTPPVKEEVNIFAQQLQQDNIFAQQSVFKLPQPSTSIFATTASEDQPDASSVFFKPAPFPPLPPQIENIFETKPNIFAQKPIPPPKGGFTFNLPQTKAPIQGTSSFTTSFQLPPNLAKLEVKPEIEDKEEESKGAVSSSFPITFHPPSSLEMEQRKKEMKEIEKKKNEEELMALEAERERIKQMLRMEEEKLEEKRLEKEKEEKRLQEEAAERRRLEAEQRIRLEAEQRRKQIEQEERKRKEEIEIQISVKLTVTKLLDDVEESIRRETLTKIRQNIQNRSVLKMFDKWRKCIIKRVKKRKALDCSPMWVNPQNVYQCAESLKTTSQDLTLGNMRSYKKGKVLEVNLVEDQFIGKIDLPNLTYSILRKTLSELDERWRQHIYWKVAISLPENYTDDVLDKYINWKEKNNRTFYIEHRKTVTYCIEKQQGVNVKYSNDSNGFVFVAKELDASTQKRIYESLKNFGKRVQPPIAVIVQDSADCELFLHNLKESAIISDYIVYCCNLSSHVLPSIIDNGLIFLSKHVRGFPPLEIDTLSSFLMKFLCTEMWRRAGSYGKWNPEYGDCLRDPNVVISLYNKGLKLLKEIVLDEDCGEYARFPEVFGSHLESEVPDFLPADYRYFPSFWSKLFYQYKLSKLFDSFSLPPFRSKWPPSNESELRPIISNYCTEAFKDPKTAFIAVFDTFKESDTDKISWLEAIEVLSVQKLKEQDFTLHESEFENKAFKTFFVVYNKEKLREHYSSDWFYFNNPYIEGYKKKNLNNMRRTEEKVAPKRTFDYSPDGDVYDVIERAEKLLKRSPDKETMEKKKQMEYINRSIEDLEESIRIIKKIDEKKLMRKFIDP